MIRIIIAGGRDFVDYDYFKSKIDSAFPDKSNMEIVSGGAPGVDAMAKQLAKEQKVPLKIFPADWKQFGRAAGPKRNQQMAEYANVLIAFWDGKSPGTLSIIQLALKHLIKTIYVHNYLTGITYSVFYNQKLELFEGSPELRKLDKRLLQSKADRELFFEYLLNPPPPSEKMIELMQKYKKNRKK